jgi:predicted nucleic acid-binding protein
VSDGHLLDTNVISVLANSRHADHDEIEKRVRALDHVWLPVIAIAEIEFGMAKSELADEFQRSGIRKCFESFPQPLGIGPNTVEPYSHLRAQLWRMHATKQTRGHRQKLPEELIDRVSGRELGIDERDLLIASIAAENGLILVTRDRNAGMRFIDQAGKELRARGAPVDLRIEYW